MSPRALREGLPSAQQMVQHEFYRGLNAEEIQARQIFKLSSQVKETMKSITLKIEERLRHDQKIASFALSFCKFRKDCPSAKDSNFVSFFIIVGSSPTPSCQSSRDAQLRD